MKRKITLLLCLFVALAIVLTGCPKVDEPAPVTPEDTTSFVRKHEGNDAYKGFTEIYFDNYKEAIINGGGTFVFVQRKTDDSNWSIYLRIFLNDINSTFDSITAFPVLIDYYADPGKTYSYRLWWGDYTSSYQPKYSTETRITTSAGLGEIKIYDGNATYNETTGDLIFSELPSVSYTPLNELFPTSIKNLDLISAEGDEILCNLDNISNNKLNIIDEITHYLDYEDNLGKSFIYAYWQFYLYRYETEYSISFIIEKAVQTDINAINIPATIPVVPFVRSSEKEGSAGFNEIFFDNYLELLTQSKNVYVERKSENSDWQTIYAVEKFIDPPLTRCPDLIDYYAVRGTEYTYRIRFQNPDTDFYKTTKMITLTAQNSLGEIQLTPGAGSFNSNTGILEFTTVPSFTYTAPSSFLGMSDYNTNNCLIFDNTTDYLTLNLNIDRISSSQYNLYDAFSSEAYSWLYGHTWTPSYYFFNMYKYVENDDYNGNDYDMTIGYHTVFYNIDGMPDLIVPAAN